MGLDLLMGAASHVSKGERGEHDNPEQRPSWVTEPLSIVLLQTQAENAGAQEISRILASYLSLQGHEVHQVFLFRRTGAFDDVPRVVFCADRRPSNPVQLLLLLRNLFRTLRRLRPDAVLTFQHFGNLIGAPMARMAGVKRVFINQNTAASMMPSWVKRLDKYLGTSRLVEAIVVNSRETSAEYDQHPEAYVRKVHRIDHGFVPKRSRLDRDEARRALGLPPGVPLLGCVGRLHPQKNLEAAIKILPHDRSWHLAIAGQGTKKPMLDSIAYRLDCADRVHFLGELGSSGVGDFLAALDAFLFPSVAETFGLAAVEAAHAGVPVVANAIPVLEEVLAIDGQPCALFVDVNDPEAFGQAVAAVLGNPELANGLSESGRQLLDRYPPEAMVDGYMRLLKPVSRAPSV